MLNLRGDRFLGLVFSVLDRFAVKMFADSALLDRPYFNDQSIVLGICTVSVNLVVILG